MHLSLAPSDFGKARSAAALNRTWIAEAVQQIEAEINRSADTHLIKLELPRFPAIKLYLKDESSHPTGSLKHRLARSLFLHALCNGDIGPKTTIIEASSGSTAVSEAYFARLLGLRFIAVLPGSTATPKIEAIRHHGGEIHMVEDTLLIRNVSLRLAAETGGHFLDQFSFAERATDWRGSDNIAASIFAQMTQEACPVPTWIVCGAGTGGTSATIGRYIRYHRHPTRLCVADPAGSVFHRHFADRSLTVLPEGCLSRVEGIGRASVEPSFLPSVIDRMIDVQDAESLGAMRAISEILGRSVGGSTGTNLFACATLIGEMASSGEGGSIVTLLCDGGDRYRHTYHDDGWLARNGFEWADAERQISALFKSR